MNIRIVAASQNEARFYDISHPSAPLKQVQRLEDPTARLHDRDLKSDRPGIVFDHAPPSSGRRGSVGHHRTGGERHPRKHAAELFAARIAEALETDRRRDGFLRVVVIAGPALLGLLRAAFPKALSRIVVAEIPKDLIGQPDDAVKAHVPVEVFHEIL